MGAATARTSAPTCTVVIAAYDAAATIAETLGSVLAQTRTDFEVIVVDDGSRDDTSARVQEYLSDPRVQLHRQSNTGAPGARNTGIALTSAPYVSMLDSDDRWLPGYLEQMVGALEQEPEVSFAFTNAWVLERAANRIWKTPWPARVPDRSRDPAAFMLALVTANFVFNSVTVKREVLQRVGTYDAAVVGVEDYDLWLRIVATGHRGAYVAGPLVVVSERPDSVSKNERGQLLGLRGVFRKVLEDPGLTPEVSAIAVRRLGEVERELELLDGSRGRPLRLRARDAVARGTLGWRRRRMRLAAPPPDVASAFPGVGCGRAARGAARAEST